MKQQLKSMAIAVGVLVALIATVFSAFATAPGLARAGALKSLTAGGARMARMAPLAACTKMEGGEVAWVTLTEDYEIDEQVDSYPSGTTMITPVFEYPCVPKKVTIVTSFTLEGEVVYSDKEQLKSSNSGGVYGYPLGTTDDSPLDDGLWGVEYYNNKTLLTSGEVVVGDEGQANDTVTVEGQVTDKKTKKAIKGATILFLVPGVTVQAWIDNDQSDDDVYTAGQTNSKGVFTLKNPIERNTEYSIVVVAKGYKPLAMDGFLVDDQMEDPVVLDVKMTK